MELVALELLVQVRSQSRVGVVPEHWIWVGGGERVVVRVRELRRSHLALDSDPEALLEVPAGLCDHLFADDAHVERDALTLRQVARDVLPERLRPRIRRPEPVLLRMLRNPAAEDRIDDGRLE